MYWYGPWIVSCFAVLLLFFCTVDARRKKNRGACRGGVIASSFTRPDLFDTNVALTPEVENPEKVLNGVTGRIKVRPVDVVAVDLNSKVFQIRRLCIKLKRATNVRFEFYADHQLQNKIYEESFEDVIKPGRRRRKLCIRDLPSQFLGGFTISVSDRSATAAERNDLRITLFDLGIRACIKEMRD